MTDTFAFDIPWCVSSKKNKHKAMRIGRFAKVRLTHEAEREEIAIRDCARAHVAHAEGAIDNRQLEEILMPMRN